MIAMMISEMSETDSGYLCVIAKDVTGSLSEESLIIHKCPTSEALKELLDLDEKIELACIDITVPKALELAELFRSENRASYIILIASLKISPVIYMRPSIRADSLILKPFQEQQVKATILEAFREILKKYENPETENVFVIDNQDGRIPIEYSSIHFFEARNKKIYLNTGVREYGFYSTIEQLENELGEQFIRCHRGFLVNRSKIERVLISKNQLFLTDGYEIPVSRTYKSVLKQLKKSEKISV